MDGTESRGWYEQPSEQHTASAEAADPGENTDLEELVTRRESSSGETARANRSWWDANADEYQAEHGEYLGDDRFLWCPEGLYEDEAGLLGPVPAGTCSRSAAAPRSAHGGSPGRVPG